MLTFILVLCIFNSIGICFYFVQQFNNTFCIVKKDVYEALIEYWTEYHDDEGNELTRELAGGCGTEAGFFRESLYDDDEEEEEDE